MRLDQGLQTNSGLATEETLQAVATVLSSPFSSSQLNPSMVLTFDGNNNLSTIAMTVGATTYTKTFTWTLSGGVYNLTNISVWV